MKEEDYDDVCGEIVIPAKQADEVVRYILPLMHENLLLKKMNLRLERCLHNEIKKNEVYESILSAPRAGSIDNPSGSRETPNPVPVAEASTGGGKDYGQESTGP